MYKEIFKLLQGEVSSNKVFGYLEEICNFHRIQVSPGITAAGEHCFKVLARNGLKTEILQYAASGDNMNWSSMVPQEWSIEEGELYLIKPGEEEERICSYGDCELSVVQRTRSTPPAGLEGPVVVVENANEEQAYEDIDVAGKWVLTDKRPDAVQRLAVKKYNALGVIVDGMPALPPVRKKRGLEDTQQYHSFIGFNEEDAAVGFVLTSSQGDRLRELCRQGEDISLRGKVKASFNPGEFTNVSALIEGEEEGEILLIAHLCHPRRSANDNASGVAAAMEAITALKKLIEEGKLRKPRRNIRLLLVPEMLGTYAYLAANEGRLREILAGLNLDMVGQKQEICGGVFLVEMPPRALGSSTGDLLQVILEESFAEGENVGGSLSYPLFRWGIMPFSGGSDHYILSDPSVGIPCPMLIQWPDRYYHTALDTPDKIDPVMLKRAALMAGTYAVFFANAGEEEIIWLGDRVAANFEAQIPAETGRLMSEYTKEDGFLLNRLLQRLNFFQARKEEDLRSLKSFLQNQAQLDKHIDAWQERVRKAVAQQKERVQEYVKTMDINIQDENHKEMKSSEELKIIPRRIHRGPIDGRTLSKMLDNLEEEEKEDYRKNEKKLEVEGFALARSYPVYLQYWMDGQRTLEEILEKVKNEIDYMNPQYALKYCWFLKKLGFIKY